TFHFRPPSAVGSKAVKQSRRKSPRQTEADIAVTERRHIPDTVGGADAHRMIAERAATQHTGFLSIYTYDILNIIYRLSLLALRIILVPFLAPAPHIAVQVEQAQVVGLLAPHRPRPLLRIRDGPGIVLQQLFRLAEGPACERPGTGRIL